MYESLSDLVELIQKRSEESIFELVKIFRLLILKYKHETSLENMREITNKEIDSDFIIFKDMLSVLNKRKYSIVMFKFYYGYSDKKIGDMLSISRQAVNKYLRQAYKTIRTSYCRGV